MNFRSHQGILPVLTGFAHTYLRRFRRVFHSVAISAIRSTRACIAVLLIYCIVPFGVGDLYAQEAPLPQPRYFQLSSMQLDQLVAPIALYPDALVAQILGAATYPTEVAEADHFVQRNGGLPPEQVARMVDSQPWDPSVKALTTFPTVLANLNRNPDWTSKLGNAYYNQPQDVMNAVQAMRQRAYTAGTLRPTPQEAVLYQPQTIVIEPVNPAVVYVPVYNPWIVYGAPVPVYPAYYYAAPVHPAGSVAIAAAVGFTVGVTVGAFAHFGWGWGHWGCGWGPHPIIAFNHVTYVSRSVTVINHGHYGGFDRTVAARSFNQTVAYGPRGGTYTDQRTVANGQYSNTRTATKPNGATYTDQRTAGNGSSTNTRTVTGSNGKTATETTSRYPGGNSATVTGPNGKTETRAVTGRGTGDATVTRSGPRGTKTRIRNRPR